MPPLLQRLCKEMIRVTDHRFYTGATDDQRIESVLRDLPKAIGAQLSSDTIPSVKYGWGCQIHPALQHIAMEVLVCRLEDFIRDSLKQGIVVPGDSDIRIEIPKGRAYFTFDHEGHIYSDGSDYELETKIWMSPEFERISLDSRCRGAGLIDHKNKQNSKDTFE